MKRRRVPLVLLSVKQNRVFSQWTNITIVKQWRGKDGIKSWSWDSVYNQLIIFSAEFNIVQIRTFFTVATRLFRKAMCSYTTKQRNCRFLVLRTNLKHVSVGIAFSKIIKTRVFVGWKVNTYFVWTYWTIHISNFISYWFFGLLRNIDPQVKLQEKRFSSFFKEKNALLTHGLALRTLIVAFVEKLKSLLLQAKYTRTLCIRTIQNPNKFISLVVKSFIWLAGPLQGITLVIARIAESKAFDLCYFFGFDWHFIQKCSIDKCSNWSIHSISISFCLVNVFQLITFLRQTVALAGEISLLEIFPQTCCRLIKGTLIYLFGFLRQNVHIWEDEFFV